MADLEGKTPGSGDIGEFAYIDSDPNNLNAYESYMMNTYGNEQRKINRDVDLIF